MRLREPKPKKKRKEKPLLGKQFMKIMSQEMEGGNLMETPMAIYEWFLGDWDRPMNDESRRQAYLAAWAVSIDKGLVNL